MNPVEAVLMRAAEETRWTEAEVLDAAMALLLLAIGAVVGLIAGLAWGRM